MDTMLERSTSLALEWDKQPAQEFICLLIRPTPPAMGCDAWLGAVVHAQPSTGRPYPMNGSNAQITDA